MRALPRMVNAERQLLRAAASNIGISLDDTQVSQLVSYVDLLEKWNQAFNLTAVRQRAELYERHIVESLAIAPFLTGKFRADIGTGAGLPGIPLAITEPGVDYVLVDSNGKKTRFLLEVKRALGLSNIEVETARVEDWQPSRPLDAAITRAFADLATTIERIDHVLHDHSVLFAMKTEGAVDELKALPSDMEKINQQEVVVPGRGWSFQLLAIQRAKKVAP